MKIGYLGPKGSFSHGVCIDYYGKNAEIDLIGMNSIPSCLKKAEEGEIDFAVVPIENSIEGTVNPTMDYLYHKGNLQVVDEIVTPIEQYLMVHPSKKVKLDTIEEIFSHHQALAQCQNYILNTIGDVKLTATDSTSAAAKTVSENENNTIAAIGPKSCSDEYGLHIMEEKIQDSQYNKTRFWILSREAEQKRKSATKATICVNLPNDLPGALHKVLSTFAWRGINLTKIESRPQKTNLGEYFFLIDIDMNQIPYSLLQMAIEEIVIIGGTVKFLGTYKVNNIGSNGQ